VGFVLECFAKVEGREDGRMDEWMNGWRGGLKLYFAFCSVLSTLRYYQASGTGTAWMDE